MNDSSQTTQYTNTQIPANAGKSAEEYIKEAEKKYIVPPLIRNKFPDLIKLIYETESMNAEEREYWLQIMPIMSEEQIVKFRGILVNERDQLAKLDKDYQSEMARINKPASKPIDEAKMKEELEKIKAQEQESEQTEQNEEAKLLEQLKNI